MRVPGLIIRIHCGIIWRRHLIGYNPEAFLEEKYRPLMAEYLAPVPVCFMIPCKYVESRSHRHFCFGIRLVGQNVGLACDLRGSVHLDRVMRNRGVALPIRDRVAVVIAHQPLICQKAPAVGIDRHVVRIRMGM